MSSCYKRNIFRSNKQVNLFVVVLFCLMLLLLVAGCGDKKNSDTTAISGVESTSTTGKADLPDNDAKSQKEGCEVFSEVKRIASEPTSSNTVAQIARLKELTPRIPEKVREAYTFVITKQEELAAIAIDDPEGQAKSAAIQGDPELSKNQQKVSDYSYDECGINLRNATSG